MTIHQGPSFVEQPPIVLDGGELGSVVMRTTGYPVPSIGLDGDLPVGLTFVDNGDGTATIIGTPVDEAGVDTGDADRGERGGGRR